MTRVRHIRCRRIRHTSPTHRSNEKQTVTRTVFPPRASNYTGVATSEVMAPATNTHGGAQEVQVSRRQAWQPPFSVELLADLHADSLEPDAGADLRLCVQQDPDAITVLEALDAVRARLSDLGADTHVATPIPDMVAARIERNIAAQSELVRHKPRARYTVRRPQRRFIQAAAGVIVTAVAAAAVILGTRHTHSDDVVAHAPADLSTHDVMAAINHNDVRGRLGTPIAMAACLQALGVNAAPLGSARIQFRGHEAVLVVVPSVTPGKVSALIVTPQCAPGAATVLARADF
jgi:anti-sigma-K factor RskA